MFAGDYRWGSVTDTYGYSFKTPGESGDLHGAATDDGPRPIDPTTPKSGTKSMIEESGIDFQISRPDVAKDWGPYDTNAAPRLRKEYVREP